MNKHSLCFCYFFAARRNKRDMKWDEMNILATYHPEGKEYGHMKIDEPPTPYSEMNEGDEDEEANEGTVDADTLREK